MRRVGLSNFSDLTTLQGCSGDLDLSSLACVLKTPSLVISAFCVRDHGRFVLGQLAPRSSCTRSFSPERPTMSGAVPFLSTDALFVAEASG